MSRRRSKSTPLPRSVGPLAPSAIASSAVMRATPLVRITQIGFPVSRFSYSSTLEGKRSAKSRTRSKKSERRLQRDSANAEIRRHHALPADRFEQPQNVFALAEAIQEHRHRADVHGVRAQPHQMRVDARQFIHQHPQPLRLRRNLQAQQLLHRQHIAEIVGHAGTDNRCGR